MAHPKFCGFIALCFLAGCAKAHDAEERYDTRRLEMVIDRPESGEETFVGFFDPEFDTYCRPGVTDDGQIRCVPWTVSDVNNYSDPECSQMVHVPQGETCPPRFASASISDGTCGWSDGHYPARVYEIASDEFLALTYQRSSRTGDCYPVPGGPQRVRRATPLPPERFVSGRIVVETSTGALARETVQWADGTSGPHGVRDVWRDSSCQFRLSGPGAERTACLSPRALQPGLHGADCMQAWAIDRQPECGPPEVGWGDATRDCGEPTVYVVGTLVEDPDARSAPECPTYADASPVYQLEPAPAGFVPWLSSELRGTGRLRRRVWVDDAGMEWPDIVRYQDAELGEACRPTVASDQRCLPGYLSIRSRDQQLFDDPACSQPAIRLRPYACSVDFVVDSACDGAASRYTAIYRLAESVEGPIFRRDAVTSECVVFESLPDDRLFRLEPDVLGRFARVTRTRT